MNKEIKRIRAGTLKAGDVIVTSPRLIVDRVVVGTPKVRIEGHFQDDVVHEITINYYLGENIGGRTMTQREGRWYVLFLIVFIVGVIALIAFEARGAIKLYNVLGGR